MESPGSFFFSSFFFKKNKKKLEGQWTSFFFRVRPLEERTICAASWAAVERVAAVRQPIVSVSHRLAHRWQCFPVAITTTFWPKKKKLLLLTTEWLDLVQMRIPKLWKKRSQFFRLKTAAGNFRKCFHWIFHLKRMFSIEWVWSRWHYSIVGVWETVEMSWPLCLTSRLTQKLAIRFSFFWNRTIRLNGQHKKGKIISVKSGQGC